MRLKASARRSGLPLPRQAAPGSVPMPPADVRSTVHPAVVLDVPDAIVSRSGEGGDRRGQEVYDGYKGKRKIVVEGGKFRLER
jgi:hypothetical protein